MTETIKYLTQTQMAKLLSVVKEAGNKRDISIFNIAYILGLRASEVGTIKYTDFNQRTQELYIRRAKNGVSGARRLDRKRFKMLMEYLNTRSDIEDGDPMFLSRKGNGLTRTPLHKLMIKYGTKAKIAPDKCHFHVLRHAIAIHLAEAGYAVKEIQWLLGHRRIETTMIYFQFTTKQQRDFYEKMDRSEGFLA